MAWEPVQLREKSGRPVSKADREAIMASVDEALLRSDRDPDLILKAAQMVGQRVEYITRDLKAYAGRCIYRALRRNEVADLKRNEFISSQDVGQLPDPFQNAEQVENRILVRELLETLDPQDREVFLRHMSGRTFPQIDKDMSLKPRTAEFRFRSCKDMLRAQLRQKLPR